MTHPEMQTCKYNANITHIYYVQNHQRVMTCVYNKNVLREFYLHYAGDKVYQERYTKKGELMYRGVHDNSGDVITNIKLHYSLYNKQNYSYYL